MRVHSLTLSFSPGLPSWPTTLQALALVTNLRPGLQHKTPNIWNSNGVKISHYGNFHESSSTTYWRLVHTSNYLNEEADYSKSNFFCRWTYLWTTHTLIFDIEGQCPTKQIETKCWGWNIITTLHGIKTWKVEQGPNNDDDDNDINILDEILEAPNDSYYLEPWPQHPNYTISHPPRSQITRASQP